jgi:hypothetical protein
MKIKVSLGWLICSLILFVLASSAPFIAHYLLSRLECLEYAAFLKIETCPIDKVHIYYRSDGPHHLNYAK